MAKNDFIINGSEPAAPVVDDCISTHNQEIFYGLTKREHFAGLAMQGILANQYNASMTADAVAKQAIENAEALLKGLEGE